MDPEAAVNPNDQQQNRLQRAEQGSEGPEIREYLRISLLEPKLAERDAGADQVIGQQERNGEAKDELGRLKSRPAESAPLVERPEAEAHMGQKRNVEDQGAWRRLPDQLLDCEAALHRANRNVAERVIDEMQRNIDIKHEAGCEPGLAKAGHCASICAIAAKSSSAGNPWFNPRQELRSCRFRSGRSRPLGRREGSASGAERATPPLP